VIYRIKSSLLSADKSYITGKLIEQPVQQTLAMYDRGEDLTNSPFIQAGQWKHHIYCYNKGNTIESAYERQQQIIFLYESIRKKGYNGSRICIWFDKEGFIHLGDGFHRIAILHYLNQDVLVNTDTDWTDVYDNQVHKDFPLADVLLKEAPQGRWTYHPIDDSRLKGWKVDRYDAKDRLDYILSKIKGKRVLDIGCSEGYYARELAKRGYEVTAIDRSAGLIAAARYLTVLAGLSVNYSVVKDWSDFLDGRYDTILFLAVIHNDMKVIGIEKGIEKLKLLQDKANVVFMEVPNNRNERGWGKDPYPKYDFHKPESVNQIQTSLDMTMVDRFNGRRVIYMFGNGKSEAPLSSWLVPNRKHYIPLFETLAEKPCKNIMEIGVFDGVSAVAMIKTAAKLVPEKDIHFYGFDLFDGLTGQLRDEEFSFQGLTPPKVEDVQRMMEAKTDAKITLFKGNTRDTLKEHIKNLPKMDLIYIDGGHTIETIRNDWHYASELVNTDTVVYFDDYCDEMPFIGSYFIRNELGPQYQCDVMPGADVYPRKFGRLKTQLLKIEMKRIIHNERRVDRFRFHLLGMPHSKTVKDWGPCAFTQLVYRFSQMMFDLGHEVYHYGTEGSNPQCTEHISVLTEKVQKQAYGDWSPYKQLWIHRGNDLAYTTFKNNAIKEINMRKQPRDMLLITNGHWLKKLDDESKMLAIEPFVGYLGCYSKRKVFPSYAWMHHIYGILFGRTKENFATGNWYDAVIPHFFDPADHTFEEKKEDYYFYFGRLIQRKGVHIAVDITKRLGAKLIVAGQPLWPDRLEESLNHVGCLQPHVEYKGVLTMPEIDKIKSKARAVFVPSLYMEPFGLIVIESLLSGTPVITTDWGAFPEIVPQGEVGYRCRTMDDFLWAARNIDKIDPKRCREYAVANYSMDRIGKAYQEYFMKVQDLFEGGWYQEHPERTNLDWLRRH